MKAVQVESLGQWGFNTARFPGVEKTWRWGRTFLLVISVTLHSEVRPLDKLCGAESRFLSSVDWILSHQGFRFHSSSMAICPPQVSTDAECSDYHCKVVGKILEYIINMLGWLLVSATLAAFCGTGLAHRRRPRELYYMGAMWG